MGDSLARQYKECCAEQSARVLAPILSELERVDRNEVHALHEVKLAGNTPEMFDERAGAAEAAAVASLLCKRKDVELLDLSYNKVDDEGAESLSVMLRENSSLKELNLCGNQIGPGGCAALCAALSSEGGGGGGILFMDLSCNPLEDDGGRAVAEMLECNDTLQLLNLSDTELSMRALVSIVAALGSHKATLKSIALENARVRRHDDVAQHFAAALARNTTLLHLRMGKLSIDDSGLSTLVDYGLVRNETLTVLDLRCNGLTSACAPALERLLTHCLSLEELCLSNNRLGDGGAAAIAAGLHHNTNLSWLELCNNSE